MLMATPQPTDRPSTDATRTARTGVERRHQQRLIAGGVIGVVVVVFAVINLNDVKVHWLIATGQTPLIVVVVLAFLLGIVADRLLLARAKKKRGKES
jgi:lipopolysaccharide assembly protein A